MRSKALVSTFLAVILFGCESTRVVTKGNGGKSETPKPATGVARFLPAIPEHVKVEIPVKPIKPVLPERDDVAGVIQFGIGLADEGRYDEAAKVFLDAAGRFVSKDQILERDLVKAAIRCHWLSGNVDALIKEDFPTLNAVTQDIYASATEEKDIQQIRQIVLSARLNSGSVSLNP